MRNKAVDPNRLKAFRRGHVSEYIAALYLLAKGYRIRAIRYRTKLGEIDIIARRGDLVVCVEVKARRDVDSALFAVSGTAQRRIRAASDIWLSRQPDAHRLSLRYDIVAVLPWRLPKHFVDAF
ncbi:YraN family protein [Shinella sp. M27]|uniref:YraN family protein n=1 Tax=Shinella sp. M27 TaxID=3368614 RepID=UPI003B9F0678